MVLALAVTTFFSTLAGGVFALRHTNRQHLLLGFTAGVLLGLVAFDLLPEIFRSGAATAQGIPPAMLAFASGFLLLHLGERAAGLHAGQESEYGEHQHRTVGLISALGLVGHSFMDGLGIGLGFQVSTQVGITVAIALIAHDFADGLNTVTIMLASKNSRRRSMVLLGLDALAPLLGATASLVLHPPEQLLGIYLGFFAGFLLYLATADILPQAHARNPSRLTLLATFGGVGAILGVVTLG